MSVATSALLGRATSHPSQRERRFEIDPPLAHLLASAVAAVAGDGCAFPFDTLKTRMQLHGSSAWVEAQRLVRGGANAAFRGLTASAVRQATYGGLRLGLTDPVRSYFEHEASSSSLPGGDAGGGATPLFLAAEAGHLDAVRELLAEGQASGRSLWANFAAGGTCGAISSAIMHPADAVKVRMQTSAVPFNSPLHALAAIAREEGLAKLWRGVSATSSRAAIVASVELGSFFSLRDVGVGTLSASIVATVAAVSISFPVDVCKTLLINDVAAADGARVRAWKAEYYVRVRMNLRPPSSVLRPLTSKPHSLAIKSPSTSYTAVPPPTALFIQRQP